MNTASKGRTGAKSIAETAHGKAAYPDPGDPVVVAAIIEQIHRVTPAEWRERIARVKEGFDRQEALERQEQSHTAPVCG